MFVRLRLDRFNVYHLLGTTEVRGAAGKTDLARFDCELATFGALTVYSHIIKYVICAFPATERPRQLYKDLAHLFILVQFCDIAGANFVEAIV